MTIKPPDMIPAKGRQANGSQPALWDSRERWHEKDAMLIPHFGFIPGWNSRNQHCLLILTRNVFSLAPPDNCSVLNSFNEYLLRACFVPGTVLGARVTRVSDTMQDRV